MCVTMLISLNALTHQLKENITVANGDYLKSEGRGECNLSVCVRDQIRSIAVKNTMFAPEAPGNLLSVKRLTDQHFEVTFVEDECHIKSNDEIVAIGKLDNSLYKLQEEKIFSAQAGEFCVHEWHIKLAHRNLNDIRKMQKMV